MKKFDGNNGNPTPAPFVKPITRQDQFALDSTSVFYSQEEFNEYLNNPTCYPGQVVTLWLNDEQCDVYVVCGTTGQDGRPSNGPFSYQKIDGGEPTLQKEVVVRHNAGIGAAPYMYKFQIGTTFTKFVQIICGDEDNENEYKRPDGTIRCNSTHKKEIDTETNTTIYYYEVGDDVSVILTTSFSQYDAGQLYRIEILKNNVLIIEDPNLEHKYYFNNCPEYSTIVSEEGFEIKAKFYYEAGQEKPTIEGDPIPMGSILSSNKLKFVGCRNGYYGVLTSKTVPDMDDIKSSNIIEDVKKGDTFTIDIPNGSAGAWFAYPASLGDMEDVLSETMMNKSISSVYEKQTIEIGGINNYSPIEYNLYIYMPIRSYRGSNKHHVTI